MTSSTSAKPDTPPSIVFFHAHPDDESIFTGGTIAKLTDAGASVTVVIATDDCHGNAGDAASVRRLEAEAAAAILKVDRLELLGYPDSGLGPKPPVGSFAATPTAVAAERVAAIAREVEAEAIVVYEPGGIYGHPDHLAVHRIGLAAARLAEVPTVYESTVDREHLHFVATHLVGNAVEALMHASVEDRPEGMLSDAMFEQSGRRSGDRTASDGKLAGGTPTVLIDTAVDVIDVLDRKRAAMAAHVSQIPPDSEVMALTDATFAAVYGLEWYVRSGPPTPLDRLAGPGD